jgi:hypothetical protein
MLGIQALVDRCRLSLVVLEDLDLMEELLRQLLGLGATEGVLCESETAGVEPGGELTAWGAEAGVLQGVQMMLGVQVIEVNLTLLIFLGLGRVDVLWGVVTIRHMEMIGLAKNRSVMYVLSSSVKA